MFTVSVKSNMEKYHIVLEYFNADEKVYRINVRHGKLFTGCHVFIRRWILRSIATFVAMTFFRYHRSLLSNTELCILGRCCLLSFRVQKKSRLHGCEPEEGSLNL